MGKTTCNTIIKVSLKLTVSTSYYLSQRLSVLYWGLSTGAVRFRHLSFVVKEITNCYRGVRNPSETNYSTRNVAV